MEPQSKSARFEFLRDLPVSISHKILSFLGIKDVARVSTLSRICREVCLSSPFLKIDLEDLDSQGFYKLSGFLHQFMSLRNGVAIHQFEVELYGKDVGVDEQLHIGNWILEASKCNVKMISLHLFNFEIFTFPSSVLLSSACLRDLEVWLSPEGMLSLPKVSFGGLENLRLRDVRVSNTFFEWISSCNSLKILYLHNVTGIDELNISSSSLEDLRLEDMLPSALNLGNLESLCCSDMSIVLDKDKHVVLDDGIIGNVLQSIYQVSSISICDYSIQEISPRTLLPDFCNLRSLTLIITNSSGLIPSIVFLLNSMPHLNTLKIEGWKSWDSSEKVSNKWSENCHPHMNLLIMSSYVIVIYIMIFNLVIYGIFMLHKKIPSNESVDINPYCS
ncbi:uncharacterized protein LOC132800660 [Ziziphus jujuba]|uniref:Uncharacterized protein LOC132800660 n=1 Tax=Ziziphus jujuba TaxID=326968 RepID=A0ABM4A293_ZIZJJ|nr:uncharacterized protein LOC132800660 [Ziziphus jujuba]